MRLKRGDTDIIRWLVGLAYFLSGLLKLSGASALTTAFHSWGYPLRFMYFIGLCEVLGALGLISPWVKVRVLSAAGLALVMAGAVVTHISAGQWGQALFPLALCVFLVAYAFTAHRHALRETRAVVASGRGNPTQGYDKRAG